MHGPRGAAAATLALREVAVGRSESYVNPSKRQRFPTDSDRDTGALQVVRPGLTGLTRQGGKHTLQRPKGRRAALRSKPRRRTVGALLKRMRGAHGAYKPDDITFSVRSILDQHAHSLPSLWESCPLRNRVLWLLQQSFSPPPRLFPASREASLSHWHSRSSPQSLRLPSCPHQPHRSPPPPPPPPQKPMEPEPTVLARARAA